MKEKYEWMHQQMNNRIKDYSGELPIWAWTEPAKTSDVTERFGDDQIRITANVPLSRCLLSDFDLWHIILNNGYFAPTVKEMEDWSNDKLELTKPMLHKSWNEIFELGIDNTQKERNEYLGISSKGREIQICVDKIYVDEIENIKIYTN